MALIGTGIAWVLWEAHSQVPEGGDAAERVGHAAGEAVVGEVQRLQPRQRAQLRRQPAGDVVVLQQPGKKKQKARRTGGGAVTVGSGFSDGSRLKFFLDP